MWLKVQPQPLSLLVESQRPNIHSYHYKHRSNWSAAEMKLLRLIAQIVRPNPTVYTLKKCTDGKIWFASNRTLATCGIWWLLQPTNHQACALGAWLAAKSALPLSLDKGYDLSTALTSFLNNTDAKDCVGAIHQTITGRGWSVIAWWIA